MKKSTYYLAYYIIWLSFIAYLIVLLTGGEFVLQQWMIVVLLVCIVRILIGEK